MTTLCKAAKHMLEVADANQYAVANQAPHGDVMAYNAAVNNLRTALKQEEEASAWLDERKEHWRKEREKAQATKDQDPELSAALGWPGGISDPVLDRKVLLQMVAALRLASQQALGAWDGGDVEWFKRAYTVMDALRAALAESGRDWSLLEATQESLREHMAEIHRLRAALAQQDEPVEVAERERVASQWDGCVTHQLDTFGPVDIGASIRAGELVEAQQAEPAHDRHGACPTHCCPVHGCKYMHDDCPVAAGAVQPVYPRNNGCESCADDALAQQVEPLNLRDPAVQKRLATQWGYVPAAQAEPVEPVAWIESPHGAIRANPNYKFTFPSQLLHWQIPLYTAPPQRTMVPLTEEEILAAVGWERAAMYMKLTPNFPVDEAKKETLTNARAVEKASWEKNHGQA